MDHSIAIIAEDRFLRLAWTTQLRREAMGMGYRQRHIRILHPDPIGRALDEEGLPEAAQMK